MAVFVFCAGACSGGWIWQPVARRLCRMGHQVYAPTYTGIGERVHLATPDITLDTHIQDVVHVLVYERLNEVILVGNSYGGAVISGVSHVVPERIRKLIYLDGFILDPGQKLVDLFDSGLVALMAGQVSRRGDGWKLPKTVFPNPDPRNTDHPFKTFTEPFSQEDPRSQIIPGAFINSTRRGKNRLYAPLASMAEKARKRGWGYVEVPYSHMPHVDFADETTSLLINLSDVSEPLEA